MKTQASASSRVLDQYRLFAPAPQQAAEENDTTVRRTQRTNQ